MELQFFIDAGQDIRSDLDHLAAAAIECHIRLDGDILTGQIRSCTANVIPANNS